MANIGAPIRKFVAVPINEPVQPTREPQPNPTPEPVVEPIEPELIAMRFHWRRW